ncbi:MAG TPA: hypothetical protein VHP13_08310 [Gammaproteobacteria bacterium]|jgi:hypothetical protein|nr:hypothetical protein [Gammaproteobacteria bacterium]
MTRFIRTLPWLTAAALLAAGCSPDSAPNPNVKKVVAACYAAGGEEVSAILGGTVEANRMSADSAPKTICAYKDAKNTTVALLQIEKGDKYPDTGKALADDQKQAQNLFSGNIKQPQFHPADGFMPGSFYGDITPRFDSLEVMLGTFEGGYKLNVVINNPKDFATGEKQAADIAHKVFENIQSGKAYATL